MEYVAFSYNFLVSLGWHFGERCFVFPNFQQSVQLLFAVLTGHDKTPLPILFLFSDSFFVCYWAGSMIMSSRRVLLLAHVCVCVCACFVCPVHVASYILFALCFTIVLLGVALLDRVCMVCVGRPERVNVPIMKNVSSYHPHIHQPHHHHTPSPRESEKEEQEELARQKARFVVFVFVFFFLF